MCEETTSVAFTGSPQDPQWLSEVQTEALLGAQPAGNVMAEQAREQLGRLTAGYGVLQPALLRMGHQNAQKLLESHGRVRAASRSGTGQLSVDLQGDPDVLGAYVFLPAGGDR